MSTWRAGEQTTLNRALAAWFLVTLFLLPLYPKVGLVAIPGTYIPVRADDLLIGALGLIWAISLIAARRRPALPTLVAGAAALWLAVTLVALVVGAFVLGSIGFLTGVAFWAKPLEYLLLAMDRLRPGAQPDHFRSRGPGCCIRVVSDRDRLRLCRAFPACSAFARSADGTGRPDLDNW